MRADKVREWLNWKGDLTKISPAKKKTLTVEDQMIIALICDAMEGNPSAFNAVMDNAYGRMRPGDGAELSKRESEVQTIDWNLPEIDEDE